MSAVIGGKSDPNQRLHPDEMGKRFREARRKRGLNLAETAELSDMSIATLSRAERGQMALSYEKFVKLARTLELDLGYLFDHPVESLGAGTCVLTPDSKGVFFEVGLNTYQMLSTQLAAKRMAPAIMHVRAVHLSAYQDFNRHEGEEFAYILSGEVELHFEDGASHRIQQGGSVYFDSGRGHLYTKISVEDAVVLGVCLHTPVARARSTPEESAETVETKRRRPVHLLPPGRQAPAGKPAEPPGMSGSPALSEHLNGESSVGRLQELEGENARLRRALSGLMREEAKMAARTSENC